MNTIKNMNKRDYRITQKQMSFGTTYKIEMWNKYGMKRTVYNKSIVDGSNSVYDYWEEEDKEYDKMKALQIVLNNKVKKEIK